MKPLSWLGGYVLFSSTAMAATIDCGLRAQQATSISVDEFYFGFSAQVIQLLQGPTVSFWGIDPENPVTNAAGITQYLLSVGQGDIAEKPRVYRVSTVTPRRFAATPTVALTDDVLTLQFIDAASGERCNGLTFTLAAD